MQERITFDGQTRPELLQTHLGRYLFAMPFARGSVLDVGCGVGYGTWLLGQTGDVVGVDVSAEAIETARGTFDGTFVQCPIETFEGGPFDCIVAFEVLEHCKNLDVVWGKIVELLKPGGVALVSLPVHQGQNPWHHGRDFTLAQWTAHLSQYVVPEAVYYQPLEGRGPSNVCILPLVGEFGSHVDGPVGDPATGVIIYVCRRPE